METLSYGYKKPATNDRGNVFFVGLEEDIQQLNDHQHNGVDSALIPTSSLEKTTAAILAASWVATSGGRFRQEMTLPTGYTFLSTHIKFTTAAGEVAYPTVEVGSTSTKYYVHTNDATLAMTASYV